MIAFVIEDFFVTEDGTVLLEARSEDHISLYSGKLISNDGTSLYVSTFPAKCADQDPARITFEIRTGSAGSVDPGIIGKTFYPDSI